MAVWCDIVIENTGRYGEVVLGVDPVLCPRPPW